MGVSTNFYTIFGIKIDWDDAFSDAYEEVYNDQDTPNVLMDGMSGEYMILGEILFDSGDARYGFEDGDAFQEIDFSDLEGMEAAYKALFEKKFPEFKHYMSAPFKLMMQAHYH